MSLSIQILLGLVLGVCVGLFFGEGVAPIGVVGDAFVRLLQMTVLPYVVVTLVSGLGRFDSAAARRLGFWGGGLLLVMWAIAFAMVVLMPFSFPAVESASFFSTSLVAPARSVDFVGLYIPSNPFHALANNIVPAVVLFSIALGIALISVDRKHTLLDSLDALADGLLRISTQITRLTPLGIFAIAAHAAGSMSLQEFQRVQVYLLSYVSFVLVATFWLLPGLVSALTPVSRRELISRSRDSLMTAFATGSSFVVIPMLAEEAKQILEARRVDRERSEPVIDVLIPAAHTFPHTAKVLSLSFIVFAGWFAGAPLDVSDYSLLATVGVTSLFGSVNVAIPFLLDLLQLPHDLFQLFLATSVVNARFGSMLQAMHVFVLSLLVCYALIGDFRIALPRLLRYGVEVLLVLVVAIVGARLTLETIVDTTYHRSGVIQRMQVNDAGVEAIVHATPPPIPVAAPGQSRLAQIMERGTVRVGYVKEGGMPFVYLNEQGELLGLEVDLVHSLARGLELGLEFVPIEEKVYDAGVAEIIASGYCDMLIGKSVLSMTAIGNRSFSVPYAELNVGFLVVDRRRKEFRRGDELRARRDLRIAIPNDPYYVGRMGRHLPYATLIPVSDIRTFLEDDGDRFDAMLLAAEVGSWWSLLRPEFGVTVPQPPIQKVPLAFSLPLGESEWQSTVNSWIELKQSDGTIQRLHEYWLLGLGAEVKEPRWSVIRDVLGWVE